MSAEEVCAIALRDADFYAESSGGVTLSGGEVLLQPEGAADLAALLKQHDIHVLLDTAGDAPWSAFAAVAPYIDQYYFDWKAPSPAAYQAIGGNYDRILSNLRWLLAEGRDVHVRIPLIEGFNTEPAQIQAMCAILSRVGAKSVDLLPFHRLGTSKYTALHRPYAFADRPSMAQDRARALAEHYKPYFEVNIER